MLADNITVFPRHGLSLLTPISLMSTVSYSRRDGFMQIKSLICPIFGLQFYQIIVTLLDHSSEALTIYHQVYNAGNITQV